MPKPTAEELQHGAEHGPIRLACSACDRGDFDGINLLPGNWSGISEEQTLEESMTTYEDGDPPEPRGYSALDWWTHIGLCPECQIAETARLLT